MKNLPIPAPTNEKGTCILCGRKLKVARYTSIEHADAGKDALTVWPKVYFYSDPNADLGQGWRHDVGTDCTYEGAALSRQAVVPMEEYGAGLSRYTASSWRCTQGDNLFCSAPCAVGFARIAANAGLRLPSMTRKERRHFRQHAQFLREFSPEMLSWSEPAPVPKSERVPRKGQDAAVVIAKKGEELVFMEYAAARVAKTKKGTMFRYRHSPSGGGTMAGDVPVLEPGVPAPKLPVKKRRSRW